MRVPIAVPWVCRKCWPVSIYRSVHYRVSYMRYLPQWRRRGWLYNTLANKRKPRSNPIFCDKGPNVKKGKVWELNHNWGPFLESPENFSGPWSHSKISNLTITKLFYSHSLNMNRGSLHTRSFKRIHFSVFRYRWAENGFTDPKIFREFSGLSRNGPLFWSIAFFVRDRWISSICFNRKCSVDRSQVFVWVLA